MVMILPWENRVMVISYAKQQPIDVRGTSLESHFSMIRKLQSGEYRLYSRKIDPRTGRRRNLGTFGSRAAAEKHERAVQFFKRH